MEYGDRCLGWVFICGSGGGGYTGWIKFMKGWFFRCGVDSYSGWLIGWVGGRVIGWVVD